MIITLSNPFRRHRFQRLVSRLSQLKDSGTKIRRSHHGAPSSRLSVLVLENLVVATTSRENRIEREGLLPRSGILLIDSFAICDRIQPRKSCTPTLPTFQTKEEGIRSIMQFSTLFVKTSSCTCTWNEFQSVIKSGEVLSYSVCGKTKNFLCSCVI